eukprot:SM000033S12323  [mRNA]  locus=s33:181838:183797:- [translate_table: standard]
MPGLKLNSYGCPAVYILLSTYVQLAKGTTHGRVDIVQSNNTLVDSMFMYTPLADYANVRFQNVGDGMQAIKSNNVVSNNYIAGGFIGVALTYGAIGVTVSNNIIRDYRWTSVQFGQGVHNVGDCMWNTMNNNYVHAGLSKQLTGDTGGIYFDTHWNNPGNTLSCNYVDQANACYYLDYASSDTLIEGGVCIQPVAGIKLNTGHFNSISSVLMVEIRGGLSAWISCQNYFDNNCLKDPGNYWDYRWQTLWATNADVLAAAPFLDGWCDRSSVDGFDCNPPEQTNATAEVTGKCSGMPTKNDVQVVVVAPPPKYQKTPLFTQCSNLTNVPNFNSIGQLVYNGTDATQTDLQFIDAANQDFGVQAGSPILTDLPNFKNCPRSQVGPQVVDDAAYYDSFWQAAQ